MASRAIGIHPAIGGQGGWRLSVDRCQSPWRFARVDETLLDFIGVSELACGVPLEPVYTGKALLALKEAIESGRVERGQRVVFTCTGGLQGRRGLEQRA